MGKIKARNDHVFGWKFRHMRRNHSIDDNRDEGWFESCLTKIKKLDPTSQNQMPCQSKKDCQLHAFSPSSEQWGCEVMNGKFACKQCPTGWLACLKSLKSCHVAHSCVPCTWHQVLQKGAQQNLVWCQRCLKSRVHWGWSRTDMFHVQDRQMLNQWSCVEKHQSTAFITFWKNNNVAIHCGMGALSRDR